jgi:tetratricopeptide (TPR) repeat protein
MRLALALLVAVLAARLSAAEALPDIDATWDWAHPDVSEARFTELLPRADGDREYSLQLITQIARAQGLQGHGDEALKTLAGIETQANEAGGKPKARWLLERGRLHDDAGELAKAAERFRAALEVADGCHDGFLALDALHMLAIADPEHAPDWTQQAITRVEAAKDDRIRGWLGPLYHNLAEAYAERGDHAKALEWHGKDLQWRLDTKRPAEEVRWAELGVATAQRHLGRLDEALKQDRALLEECAKQGVLDTWFIGLTQVEVAECLLAQKQEAAAKKQFGEAWELLKDELEQPQDDADRKLKSRLMEMTGNR